MEVATAGLESVKRFAAGFRVPDFSKLWGHDVPDGPSQQPVPMIIKLEYYLVRCQELALWKDPKSSLVALAGIHLAFGYVATTSNTVLNLTLWALLSGFVYTTWTQRIWPEIRVPEENEGDPQSSWTPVSPDVYSAPELIDLIDRLKTKTAELYHQARTLRSERPGAFCAYSSLICLAVGYLGTMVTALGLLYYTVVGSFVMPALVKVMASHPELSKLLSQISGNSADTVDGRIDVKAEENISRSASESQDRTAEQSSSPLASQMSGMMASVCTSLTSGMASIASQLPDMSQLEQTRADLKSRGQDLTSDPNDATSTPDNMEESLMSPYLPDSGDLANHQIMESAYVASDSPFSTSETAQKDGFQGSGYDEDESLIPPSISDMPGHDEIELEGPSSTNYDNTSSESGSERLMSDRQMSLNSLQGTVGSDDYSHRQERLTDEEEEEDENREFLPSHHTSKAAPLVRKISDGSSSSSAAGGNADAAAQLLLSESVEEGDSLPIRSQPPSEEPPAARLSGSCPEAEDDDSFLRNSSFEQKLKQEVAAVVEGSMESVEGGSGLEDQELTDDDFEVLSASEISADQSSEKSPAADPRAEAAPKS